MEKDDAGRKAGHKPLKPVYYFYGAEDYLIEEAVNGIKDRALAKGMESLNFAVFDRTNFNAEDVVTAASTMPAFSDKRVVVVRDAGKIKAKDEVAFCEYVKRPSPDTCLVFIAEGARIGKGDGAIKASNLIAMLSEMGYVKRFDRLSADAALAWIKKEAARLARPITDGAGRRIHLMSGGRLRAVKNELEKIALFTAGEGVIDEEAVAEAGLDCREETVFGLSDAIGAKDLKRALTAYKGLSNEEPFVLIGAIARQMRIMLKIKLMMKAGCPRAALARELNVYPAHLEGYMRGERRFTIGELTAALKRFHKADAMLKTGRTTAAVAMPRLIIDLCSP